MADEMKIGAYICKGCGIGDRLDAGQLETTATRDGKAAICQQSDFLCSEAGVKMIQDDIDNEGVNHVVIAACSRRAKAEAFAFENVTLSRANLREGVIWVRPDEDDQRETTQEMADDYVRMACAESKAGNIPAPSDEQSLNKTLLVVGGGITGLTTALESAKAGYQVELVEKTGKLGGWTAQLHKRTPNRSPYAEPVDTGIDALIKAVNEHSNINLHLNSTIANTAGAPGRFTIEIATESGTSNQVEVGAIVQATGFKMYDTANIPEFSHQQNADVVASNKWRQFHGGVNGRFPT